MLRKALLILSGNAAASLLLLARNLIVARIIPVADYGIASTFALAMAVVEMTTAFGLQQQIVQSKDGDDPRFQAALQGFQLLRGVVSGLILFLLAAPLARFMGIPEVIWAYQILAIVPVLNALAHFDIYRLNRQMRFGPLLLTGAVSAGVALALIWPLTVWFADWRVMLWSIIAQAVVMVMTSHLTAERPYRLVWSTTVVAGSLRFGWPLLVNGILMFLVFQGDKLIVGHIMGMEALAIFAMGVTLTLAPTLVLAQSAQDLFLPKLSQRAGSQDFALTAQQTMQIVSLAALIFTLVTVLIGGPVLSLLLGAKYAELLPLLVWFAAGQALRVMKAGPAIVALSMGQTANAMVANLVRVLSLPLAWIAATQGSGLLVVLVIALTGEGLSLVMSIWLMLRRTPLPAARIFGQQAAIAILILAAGGLAWYQPSGASPAPWPMWLASGIALIVALAIMPETTRGFRSMRMR